MTFMFRSILCSSLLAIGLGSTTPTPYSVRGSLTKLPPTSNTTTTNTTNSDNKTLPPNSGSDGISTHVIGGQVADSQRYPYAQVSLQDANGVHMCGGSVLAPDIILSAGHCAIPEITTVVVGVFDLSNYSYGTVETFGIKKKYRHPDYSDVTLQYDALVIKLDGAITIAAPVRINDDYSVPNPSDILTVVGWGATSDDGYEYPEMLQEVNLFYLPNRLCKRIVDDDGYSFGSELTEDMMCATDEGKDSCYGDSGGPLIWLGTSPAEDVQVGVVSWGQGCAGVIPGVYHRLSHSYIWIQSMVCSRSAAPPDYFNCS